MNLTSSVAMPAAMAERVLGGFVVNIIHPDVTPPTLDFAYGQATGGSWTSLVDTTARWTTSQLQAALKALPVVVLTSSTEPDDLANAYALGANSYLRKPMAFRDLLTLAKHVADYWLDLNELPRNSAVTREHGSTLKTS